MIKRKGVCDVCNTEFELDEGSFGMKIVEDDAGPSSRKWTITASSCADGCVDEGFSQVCGLTCLYEALRGAIEKKKSEADPRLVGHDGVDDSKTRVIDLTDRKNK